MILFDIKQKEYLYNLSCSNIEALFKYYYKTENMNQYLSDTCTLTQKSLSIFEKLKDIEHQEKHLLLTAIQQKIINILPQYKCEEYHVNINDTLQKNNIDNLLNILMFKIFRQNNNYEYIEYIDQILKRVFMYLYYLKNKEKNLLEILFIQNLNIHIDKLLYILN